MFSVEIPISDITITQEQIRLYELGREFPEECPVGKLEICVNTYKFGERLALAYCCTSIYTFLTFL